MDGIVRYTPAVFVLDYLFETSCSRIWLFVDSQNEVLIGFIQKGLGAPKFFGDNGSLFFIQCPQALLTVRTLTFISVDMILELTLLVLARIIYLTLAGVSLKTLFLLPLPIPYRSG
jgi:hypothetical protein